MRARDRGMENERKREGSGERKQERVEWRTRARDRGVENERKRERDRGVENERSKRSL